MIDKNTTALKHRARKRFGQHFLHEKGVIQAIVHALQPRPGETLIEIGPGLGALTTVVLPLCQRLQVIELDRDVLPHLRQACQHLGELLICEQDVMHVDFNQFVAPLRLFGNLPYNISTPLLFHLLTFRKNISEMVFMLQKEVVERICARPGNKQYGRLSIMLQYYCQVEKLFLVAKGAFAPPPKVESAVIRLQPYSALPVVAKNEVLLAKLVQCAFSKRRKTLRNSLQNLVKVDTWKKIDYDNTARPEQLSVAQWVLLSNRLSDYLP